jgi:hypothetical protein
MNSEQLADIVEANLTTRRKYSDDIWSQITDSQFKNIVALCRKGIMGPGREQYYRDGKQKFEDMPLEELVDYIKEECRDQINYGVMATWRMDQISLALVELSRRSQIQELVAAGKIVGVVKTDTSNLSALADCVD